MKENIATEKEIDDSRVYATDAAIVRIMKGTKKMTHEELLVETIRALERSFQLQPKTFKRRVDDLIEREFIKRDDDDSALYHYIS